MMFFKRIFRGRKVRDRNIPPPTVDAPPKEPLWRKALPIVVYIALLGVYLGVGAAVLNAIEGPREKDSTGRNHRFNFGSCVYFFIISTTTVGFGDVVPTSGRGKAFAACWIVVGMGGVAVLIGAVGNYVKNVLHRQKLRFEERKGAPPFFLNHFGLISSGIVFLITLFVGAAVFEATERPDYDEMLDWRYSNALWFAFACLFTIGYGDLYVQSTAGKCLLPIYLMITLGIAALVVGEVSEKASNFSKKMVERANAVADKIHSESARSRIVVQPKKPDHDSIKELDRLFDEIEKVRAAPRDTQEEVNAVEEYIKNFLFKEYERLSEKTPVPDDVEAPPRRQESVRELPPLDSKYIQK